MLLQCLLTFSIRITVFANGIVFSISRLSVSNEAAARSNAEIGNPRNTDERTRDFSNPGRGRDVIVTVNPRSDPAGRVLPKKDDPQGQEKDPKFEGGGGSDGGGQIGDSSQTEGSGQTEGDGKVERDDHTDLEPRKTDQSSEPAKDKDGNRSSCTQTSK